MNWTSFFIGAVAGGSLIFVASVLTIAFTEKEIDKMHKNAKEKKNGEEKLP